MDNVPALSLDEPSLVCPFCPRLVAFREVWRQAEPDWHNAPVPSFGQEDGRLLIVGLAPGVRGANRTGRPFTGDYAGELLYSTLIRYGFATGKFEARPDDTLRLVDAQLTNAVRCVPPENKPTTEEMRTCRPFLSATIGRLPRLSVVVALGKIAHDQVVVARGERMSRFKFAHGAEHRIGDLMLFDSYHCSRYNTNTGVLTTDMFHAVFSRVRSFLDSTA